MRVFAGFHVFPGGTLHPDDEDRRLWARSTLPEEDAAVALGEAAGDQPPLAFYMCAIRELFEEAGLLMATSAGRPVDPSSAHFVAARRALIDTDVPFSQIAKDLDLVLLTDRLRFQTRWVAPESLPVRFDLRVFVAEDFGEVLPDPHEADAAEWLAPGTALGMAEAGAIQLAPPTIGTLNAIMRFDDVAALMGGKAKDLTTPEVIVHSDRVRRIVAPNASMMTGPGTNTYIVGRGPFLVIDPGAIDASHLAAIAAVGEIASIVITHGHPDHFPGALDLADMTGAEVAASSILWDKAPFVAAGRRLTDGERLQVGGTTLEVLFTPGHASDHICLWMEHERALFSGDLILGEGTTVISPPDGDLNDYMYSLERMRALAPERLYPGHFPPRDDASEWIDYYIAHRKDREQQIVAALTGGASTIDGIIGSVYAGYPSQLYPIAARSVLAHLLKLIDAGLVVADDERYRLVTRGGDA